jgi:hypothetical protein
MSHVGATFDLCGEGNHLRIIISKKNDLTGCVLVCNLTDYEHDPDCLCKIKAGEHPRVTKPSVIEMRKLIELPIEGFVSALKSNSIVFREDFSPALVQRIITAVLETKSVPPKFKRYLQ